MIRIPMHWLLGLVIAAGPLLPAWAQDQSSTDPECVILLHGLARTALSMKWIEWELVDHGYSVVNPTYPSLSRGIGDLATTTVGAAVEECRASTQGTISFVTHSMGGILVRAYLKAHDLPELARVVMLGPPNQGSEIASWVASIGMLEGIRPPAVEELSKELDSIPRGLGPVQFDLGVIAGSRNLRAFLPGVPEKPSDGTVTVAETRVEGMGDFIELPVTHTFLVWDEDVIHQILAYLRTGRFDHSEKPDPNQ